MPLTITMGIAYRQPLTAALIELGGMIHAEQDGDGSTTWTAVATFPPERDRRRKVTEALWAKFPGAQVTVVEANNDV